MGARWYWILSQLNYSLSLRGGTKSSQPRGLNLGTSFTPSNVGPECRPWGWLRTVKPSHAFGENSGKTFGYYVSICGIWLHLALRLPNVTKLLILYRGVSHIFTGHCRLRRFAANVWRPIQSGICVQIWLVAAVGYVGMGEILWL